MTLWRLFRILNAVMEMYNDRYECAPKGIPLVGYYKCITDVPARYVFTNLHYHSDFEILYITGGKGEMIVGDNRFSAGKGSLILIHPYEVHYGEITGENLSYYCLDFSMEWLFSDYASGKEPLPCYENHVHGEEYGPFIQNVLEAYLNNEAGWILKARGNLSLLFSMLQSKTVPAKEPENRFVKQVIGYLNEHYLRNVTSKDAAEALCYDQSYFCRTFKKYFSVPFGEYRNAMRLKEAGKLLRNNSVTDTAARCGFSQLSQFSAEFKKTWGISPAQYKKENSGH